MLARLFLAILPTLLLLEAALSGLWIWQLIPGLSGRGIVSIVIIAARGLVSVAQMMSSWGLRARRPFAATLAARTLIAAGVLLTFEVGFRLAPSNLDPSFRWPAVGAYWLYVGMGMLVLSKRT